MILFQFLASFFLSLIFIYFSRPILKKLFPSEPTNRGMHSYTKPSSGGILFVTVYLALIIYQGFLLPLISLPISIVGTLDDKFNISSLFKFIFQILTVLIIILFSNENENSFLNLIISQSLFFIIILTIFGASVINFVNFMDGIDGLVCGSMIIILISINSTFHYLYPAIGALSGFLIFNWQPSKIFMGDSGSLFLGSLLVTLMFNASSLNEFFKIILVCTPILIDPLITLIRRALKKQNIFKPHKQHLYQRLVSNGLSHQKVSLIYICSTISLGIVYNFSNFPNLLILSFLILIFGFFLDKKFALKFN